ncbi:hypothetical protein QEH52_19215 [Coraliomargarita sp. SDUM461003]|uniref:Secretin/TonB short N-terminal domain-containing protein n=1 Tax=Thalassobacterium maritimum TaxID=3041265 RepID=A0ABU1B1K3_9BACT|nr:hypothetical protein [Coraliomargarita sp. SDUM461003]MDQ8209657.1 hypothetical protein [Coraliomargarita sp. SDUM461003]
MKNISLILLIFATSISVYAKEFEPLTVDLQKETVAKSILNVATLFNIDVVVPDSAMDKYVSVLVKKKDPIDILRAIATASGYELIEANDIYIFQDKPLNCVCRVSEK